MRRLYAVFAVSALAACAAPTSDAASSEEGVTEKSSCPSAALAVAVADVASQAAACAIDPPPAPYVARPWRHGIKNAEIAKLASHHRGRDTILAQGDDQWVLAKLAYGPLDVDLKDEEVDVFVQRGCAGGWEKLAFDAPVVSTPDENTHPDVDGVADTGGRVFARIPDAQRLGIGHHRVRVVVAGDGTYADQEIEVLPRGTPILVSDVDGTLTERIEGDSPWVCDEESDFPALWRSLLLGEAQQPHVHEGAPALYQELVRTGYRPFYLTARPEWLAPHTHAFLQQSARGDGRGDLPRGVVHTTLGLTGSFDAAAEAFKKAEMRALEAKGFVPVFGFGNRTSDVATYDEAKVRYGFYFQNKATIKRACSGVGDLPLAPAVLHAGDWRFPSYASITPQISAFADACR